MSQIEPEPELMTPAEVARVFHIGRRTVTRWTKAGKLTCVRTLGGHRRYFRLQVDAMLDGRLLTHAETEMLRRFGGRS